MNIRFVTTVLVIFFAWSNLSAQGAIEERIQEERVKFFTQELQLTQAESKVFWPLFDQYRTDERSLENQYKSKKKLALLTDEEVEAHIYKMFELEEKKVALKKSYFEQLKEKLPIRKIAMLESTERKFKRMVLKKIQNNRAQRRGN